MPKLGLSPDNSEWLTRKRIIEPYSVRFTLACGRGSLQPENMQRLAILGV